MERLNTDPRFTAFLTPDGRAFTPEQSAAAVARWRRHWDEHGFGLWAVEERDSGRFVGRVGVQFHRLWPDDPEVGWGIDPERWGRGYATEAGAATRDAAFNQWGYDHVISLIRPVNVNSKRVAQRLGMTEGRRVQFHGYEHCVFELARPEQATRAERASPS
jgi:RimJ/RimL family protein N-acetyltransferase